jgi:hypothetical protein
LENNYKINDELNELNDNQEKDSELPKVSLLEHRNSIFVSSSYSASLDGIA